MADELQTKRIIELAQKTGPEAGDNLAIDNATSGTRRILWENLLDENLANDKKAAPAGATGRAIEGAKTTFTDTGDGNIAVNYDENVTGGTEVPLQSIRFPMLPYKYTIPQITTDLTESGKAADAKAVGDRIDGKVSKPTSSPNGTTGQLLRTNGDGTTQWVDQGLPTDEQTAEAISEWLTDHPEATTTVQDGAVTEGKLANGAVTTAKLASGAVSEAKLDNTLKLKVIKDYVTPEMFGAVGDGITDDTAAFQNAINAASENVLFLPKGIYLITDQLEINRPISIIGALKTPTNYSAENSSHVPTSYIKAGASIASIFKLYSDYVTIKDVGIDANNSANYGLLSDDTKYISRINCERVQVKGATKDGFHLCCYLSTFINCIAFNCGEIGFNMGSSVGSRMTSNSYISCYANQCPTGYNIRPHVYSSMISCACDNSTTAYIIRSSQIIIEGCGCERTYNPMEIYGCVGISVINFYVANIYNANGENTNGAIITTFNRTQNLTLSGLMLVQNTQIENVEIYEGYKLKLGNDRLGSVNVLDDSIKYAEIYCSKADKYPVSFPSLRSVINNLMTLDTSTLGVITCKKLHNGEFLLSNTELDADHTKVFQLCSVSLEPGRYVVKGTEETTANSYYSISVGTNGYGSGVIANDSGEMGTFLIESTQTVYIAIQMKANEVRTIRFIPEIIKVA